MFTRFDRLIMAGLAFLMIVAFAALNIHDQVSAAPSTIHSNNSCLSCHEDLYYLHDTGCWYCMTDAHKDRCTDCHEGNPASFKVEDAHVGMLQHPQENNGEKCLECHTEDVQARLDTFDSKGGFKQVLKPVAYTPSQPIELGYPDSARESIVEKLPWVVGGIVLFGFWLALVLLSPNKP